MPKITAISPTTSVASPFGTDSEERFTLDLASSATSTFSVIPGMDLGSAFPVIAFPGSGYSSIDGVFHIALSAGPIRTAKLCLNCPTVSVIYGTVPSSIRDVI